MTIEYLRCSHHIRKLFYAMNEVNKSAMTKINGETITGIALIFLALLFIFAASVNNLWKMILPADFLLIALGVAFLVLGFWDLQKYRKKSIQKH
jgi:cadmium resistance protein CadD (predicted permease)